MCHGRKRCLFIVWFLIATLAGNRSNATTLVWQHHALGQMFDCNGPAAGGEYQWPDNSLWSQQEVRGTDPCGNHDVVLEPSNWNAPFYPDNNAGFNFDVVLGDPANTILDVAVEIDTLTVENDGSLEILGGSGLDIVGGSLTNDSIITINSDDGPNTVVNLFFPAGTLISGTGQILMNRGNAGAWINAGAPVTQAAGHTIRGKGWISAPLTNEGVIEAAPTSGGEEPVLLLYLTNQTNNNIIRATPGATLRLQEITLTQDPATGRLVGDAMGVDPDPSNSRGNIELGDGAHIVGGRLEGDIDIADGTVTLENVTNLSSTLDSVPGTTTQIRGPSFANNGTFSATSPVFNQFTHLRFLSDTLLTGTGELALGQFNAVRVAAEPGVTVTNDTDHTITGQGKWFAPLVNHGMIEGFSLAFENTTIQNHATMTTLPNGGIAMVGTMVTQDPTNGVLLAGHAGSFNLNTTTIVNGRLEDTPSATAFSGFRVSNVRLVNVHNQARINVLFGTSLGVEGAVFTNDGPITVNSDSLALGTEIEFQDDVLLNGTGEILLNEPGLGAQLEVLGGGMLTHAATHQIRGPGRIDASVLINHGAITGTSEIHAQVENHGTMTSIGEINGDVLNEGSLEGTFSLSLLDLNGTLTGTGPLAHIQINGTHEPGLSVAAIAVTGEYVIGPMGTLAIEIGGMTAGTEYDVIEIIDPATGLGHASLDGTLSVELVDLGGGPFVPNIGDMFTIITATPDAMDKVLGTFATEELPKAAGGRGLTWQVHYNPHDVTLELLSALTGDYNGNGIVDAADYTVWRDTLGSTTELAADGDGSGTIDAGDFAVWKAQFGMIAGRGSALESFSAATVPEPATLLLIAISLAVSLIGRLT